MGDETGDGTVDERALAWISGPHTGLSSECIWRTMMGVPEPAGWRGGEYPHDPDDFNRCRLLLNQVPEWRERLPGMARHSPVWAALVARWDEIEASLRSEYGEEMRWNGGRETYTLMRAIIESAETTDGNAAEYGGRE